MTYNVFYATFITIDVLLVINATPSVISSLLIGHWRHEGACKMQPLQYPKVSLETFVGPSANHTQLCKIIMQQYNTDANICNVCLCQHNDNRLYA